MAASLRTLAGCLLLASSARAQRASLVITDSVHVVGALAREPMVVEHPSGALFVSGYSDTTPKLWKSRDRGATWARVNVGTASDGAIGNSDVDLPWRPTARCTSRKWASTAASARGPTSRWA